MTFILFSCKASKKSPEQILEVLENANTYTAEGIMNVKNNKSIFTYNMKQYYKKPGKIKIDFYNDDGSLIQSIIYNNGQCEIFHIGITKPYLCENFTDTKDYNSSLNTFLKNYRADERAYVEIKNCDGKECYSYKCSIINGNSYFNSSELIIDAITEVPGELIIYGSDGSKTIAIAYKNFAYNEDLDDSIFDIKTR